MNSKNALTLLALMILITMFSVIAVPTKAQLTDEEYKHGPRSDELLINFYADVEGGYGALKTGAIDAIWYDITYEQYLDAIVDPNIQLVSVDDMGMYEIDINNNYTIATYPTVRNPCHEVSFRQAMAWLFDKSYVVAVCCGGFAVRIDVPVAAPVDVAWINTSVVDEWGGVWYGNYPYSDALGKSDPWKAQQLFDDNGFVVDTTKPNPAYDPSVPWSQEYLRTYPSDWDGKAGQVLDPLVCCIRSDDARRLCMGNLLAANLELSGIPCDEIRKSMAGLYGKVMGAFDYHFYTGGWSLGRFPIGQHGLYHGDFWYPWAPNYVTGVDKNGDPNYPDLDAVLEDIYYCESIADSQVASRKAQSLFVEKYCICLWAYSARAYWAYRNLIGVVNMDGYSLDNEYTFMNMRTVDGDRPTIGLITPPYQQNVLMSSWFYDRQVMDRYYGAVAGISFAPYSLARDQPWVIQDWTPTTWVDPEDGENKTKVVVWFRENVEWVSPVTGAVYDRFTAHDFVFSEWFITAFPKAWTHDDKRDIHHIKIIDDYCIEIYMVAKSYWLQYVGDYVIHKELWQDKFCFINTTTVTLDKDYASCDKLWLGNETIGAGQILQVVDVTLGVETLIEDIDFEIVMLKYDHNYFHWLRPAVAGQVLTIIYWTPDPAKSPDGYWPGELPWEQIAVGIGTHYLVDYVRHAGGYAALKANRHFWLETPVPDPKGIDHCSPLPAEVDWVWEWGPRDAARPAPNDPRGPRCGYYVVDISDVVLCTAAWKSHGNTIGAMDPRWFAGADLAPPECFIDIADVVTITGRYRRKFGGWSKVLICP